MNQNDTIQSWLEKSLRLPGVTAAAVCDPEGNCVARTNSQHFDAAAVEHAIKCASDAFAVLRFQQLPCEWLHWEFEGASFFCASTRQHACLGIFAGKDAGDAHKAQIERLLDEFVKSAG